jgi:hypothetical protein
VDHVRLLYNYDNSPYQIWERQILPFDIVSTLLRRWQTDKLIHIKQYACLSDAVKFPILETSRGVNGLFRYLPFLIIVEYRWSSGFVSFNLCVCFFIFSFFLDRMLDLYPNSFLSVFV